jgi:hypothetical protein
MQHRTGGLLTPITDLSKGESLKTIKDPSKRTFANAELDCSKQTLSAKMDSRRSAPTPQID